MRNFGLLCAGALAFCGATLAQAANEVKLLRGQSTITYRYGNHQNLGWEVKIANLAYAKQVFAHVKKSDGSWIDVPLSYKRAADTGYEIWEANWFDNVNGVPTGEIWDSEFALKYVVNGYTYWDNNGGRNYKLTADAGAWLQNGINVLNRFYSSNSVASDNSLYGSVTVRNLGPTKDVTVVYSTDGWKTTQSVKANYNPTYWFGSYSRAANPNAYGSEEWNYVIPAGTAAQVQLAIKYTVNGQVYWDNNYGRNYTVQLQRY